MAKDYYKILGVARNASEEEIKKAYRKLAHQHHPDKTGGEDVKFKEINEAYQVLSNKDKRSRYDQFGSAEGPAGFGGQGSPFAGWDFSNFEGFGAQGFGGETGDLGDILEDFFEGIGVKPRRRTYRRGSDLETVLTITLEEAFHGATKELHVRTLVRCESCSGQGGEAGAGFETCSACNGQGEIREERRAFFGAFSQVKACTPCRGTGQIPKKPCPVCKGSGRVNAERTVRLELAPGIQSGQIIKIAGKGEAGERGTTEGDLYVRIVIQEHSTFARHGDDLVVQKELDLVKILLGEKIEAPTISGGKINVEIPAGFNLKEDLRVRGEGMPHFGSSGRGDLLVNFTLKTPKKITPRIKKLLEDWQREG